MALNNIVVLVGGVGGAKLAYGLAHVLQPEQLTVIVNTGDDFWHYGLRVCPDLDTVMYTLSGLVDKTNGWGVAGDTTVLLDALRRYGEDAWFRLGDQDMATHLLRSEWLRAGETLTAVTQKLTTRLGIRCSVLPMTDAPVPTIMSTLEHGELDFQTYFVRHRWQPTVTGIRFSGIESATLLPEVEHAIASADALLIAPSNPWLSIAPILAVPGMRAAIEARDVPKVAISPIIDGSAVKGPAAKLMAELQYESSAKTVAEYYAEIINGFVYDERDRELHIPTARAARFDTLMLTDDDRVRLTREVLGWIESWKT